MPSEVAIPFTLTQGGQIAMVSDPDSMTHQHVSALLSTLPGQRPIYRDYGTDTASLIFQDEDVAAADLPMNINNAFTNWEPGVILNSVGVNTDSSTGTVSALVTYDRSDSVDSSAASTGQSVVNIGLGGVVTEIVRG